MAIEDYKITTEEINEKHVEAQPDELTGTPDENKSVFDTLVEFVVEKLNGLIDFLAGNFISASQISDGLSTDVDNNVTWKYEIVKGESQGINFSGTVNYNTKTVIKSSPLPFLTLRNAIVKIGDTEYLMDNGVFATESYAEYDGKFRLSSDATNTYITILDETFSSSIGTYLTIEVYVTSATTVPAKSLPLVVGEATGEFLQEQINGINTNIGDINTNIGDMALSTVATDLTGAINETHKDLLWTNASPTSDFAAQTILSGIDLSIYDMIEVVFHNGETFVGWAETGKTFYMSRIGNVGGGSFMKGEERNLTINPTSGIVFTGATTKVANTNTATADNTKLKPYKIYGRRI